MEESSPSSQTESTSESSSLKSITEAFIKGPSASINVRYTTQRVRDKKTPEDNDEKKDNVEFKTKDGDLNVLRYAVKKRVSTQPPVPEVKEKTKCPKVVYSKSPVQEDKPLSTLGPNWYQELSNNQISIINTLERAQQLDSADYPNITHTKLVLHELGIFPLPKDSLLLKISEQSLWNPILFFLFLYKAIRKAVDSDVYTINERLLLSSMTYLVMPRTLIDLDGMLPAPKIPKVLHPETKKMKKERYASPYLEPLVLCFQQPFMPVCCTRVDPNAPNLGSESHTTSKDSKKKFSGAGPKTSQKQSALSSVYNIPKRDQKSRYFKRQGLKRNVQLDPAVETLAGNKPCEVEEVTEDPNTDNIVHAEVNNWQVVATNSQPSFVSEKNPFFSKFMENMTQSEDESMATTPSDIDSKDDQMATTKESSFQATINAAISGYFKVAPSQMPKMPKKGWLTTKPPNRFTDSLKTKFEILAQNGNPVAALPMSHILPQVQKWFLQRQGYNIDESYLAELQAHTCGRLSHAIHGLRNIQPPSTVISAKAALLLTWDNMEWLRKKVRQVNNKYYKSLRQAEVEDVREYGMFMTYCENNRFRDVFYAYFPSRERDVFPIRPPTFS